MKYVMFVRTLNAGQKVAYPIIFPDLLIHADVAKFMHRGDLRDAVIDSAGFVNPFTLECFGKSESLGIESKPERDTQVVKMMNYGGQFIE